MPKGKGLRGRAKCRRIVFHRLEMWIESSCLRMATVVRHYGDYVDALKSWKHVEHSCANSSVHALSSSYSKSTLNSLAFIAILKVQEQVLQNISHTVQLDFTHTRQFRRSSRFCCALFVWRTSPVVFWLWLPLASENSVPRPSQLSRQRLRSSPCLITTLPDSAIMQDN